ncbi:hypothetical protein GKC30_02805 [Pseudodesulfovibrio sp. F-1]|uniref:Uncharacterized protein n=1 Tax=Pseudodesulfovibrio alkaliphilus TaxID=2661613 RepID=A0A7K1KKJ2_9BACT|nr:hypothetical protein [Pseudodesulfovibrio alkaliphilus]MUM76560.1 hypothetical protein [Pseudodesulfovibrio alkaliphilus]
MNRIDQSPGLEPRIDQLSKKIRELRGGQRSEEGLDAALDAVERNSGRREAAVAAASLAGLGDELSLQGAHLHGLDPSRVADLISDPFADE